MQMSNENADIDWSFMIGKEAIQISIGLNELQMHFDSNISISVEGPFTHEATHSHNRSNEEMRIKATSLVSLLGAVVEQVTNENDAALRFDFNNQEVLRLFARQDGYEAFTVVTPGRTIVVTDNISESRF